MRNCTHRFGLIFLPLRLVTSGSLAPTGSGWLATARGVDADGMSTTAADDVAFGETFSPLVFLFCDFTGFFPSSMTNSPSKSSIGTAVDCVETSKDTSTVVLTVLSSKTVLLAISSASSVAEIVGAIAGGS